jgi:hypothetical protein
VAEYLLEADERGCGGGCELVPEYLLEALSGAGRSRQLGTWLGCVRGGGALETHALELVSLLPEDGVEFAGGAHPAAVPRYPRVSVGSWDSYGRELVASMRCDETREAVEEDASTHAFSQFAHWRLKWWGRDGMYMGGGWGRRGGEGRDGGCNPGRVTVQEICEHPALPASLLALAKFAHAFSAAASPQEQAHIVLFFFRHTFLKSTGNCVCVCVCVCV